MQLAAQPVSVRLSALQGPPILARLAMRPVSVRLLAKRQPVRPMGMQLGWASQPV
jgi:hypothetical protein